MTASPNETPRPNKNRRFRLLVVVAVLLGGLWFSQEWILGRLLEAGMSRLAPMAGLNIETGRIRARIDRPWVFENLRVHADPLAANASVLEAAELIISWNWLPQMFGPRGRIFSAVELAGFRVSVDLREDAQASAGPMERSTEEKRREEANQLLWLMPRRVVLREGDVAVVWDGGGLDVDRIIADFDETSRGKFATDGIDVVVGDRREGFAAQRAVTAWKDGQAFLADWEMRRGMKWETISVQLARPGGIGIDASGEFFGGLLRGGAFFGELRGEPGIDAAIWASGLAFSELFEFAGIEGVASGRLTEARLTYRGNPDRPLDAEAGLYLAAEDFRWGERGWKSLECSGGLINRRLTVSGLNLRQEDNSVSVNGEVALSGDWNDIASSPFLLNLSADIHDLGSLSALVGAPFDEMSGRMSVNAALSGRRREIDGFLSIESSGAAFRNHPVDAVRLDVNFQAGEARVGRLEIWSRKDKISGKGAVGLESPHAYNGELQVRIADLAAYAGFAPGAFPFSRGALEVDWQGDGTWKSHSGAFSSHFEDAVTEWTPAGLSAEFAGTYSPGNVYFRSIRLESNPLSLTASATLAVSGIKVDDLLLRAGKKEIAGGQLFLPLNPFVVPGDKGWLASALLDKPVYVGLDTRRELPLDELFGLAGQPSPLDGKVRAGVDIQGPLEALTVESLVTASRLQPAGNESGLPPTDATLKMTGREGRLELVGSVVPRGFPSLALHGQLPFGLRKEADGQLTWIDPAGQISGSLVIPRVDLRLLQPFLVGTRTVQGTLSGNVSVTGSASAPQFAGRLGITGGRVAFPPPSPSIDNVEVGLEFAGPEIRVSRIEGTVGAGPFSVSGAVSLQQPSNPEIRLALEAEKVLLYRTADTRVRANASLRAEGNFQRGSLTGSIRLVDGRIFRRLEITPFITPGPDDEEAPFTAPVLKGLVPPPLGLWSLDVTLTNDDPFLLVGNLATGEFQPDFRLTGTLGDPMITGELRLVNTRAFLPFTSLDIASGTIRFEASDPWMPLLDIRGQADAMDYEVFLHATGPLSEKQLQLRSDPPLSQEEIILLLGTGLVPGARSGAGFGQAAAGQGGMLLLRTLLRQVDVRGVDTESLINRLQISNTPPQLPGERAGMVGRLRLWQGLSLMAEQDQEGFYRAGATYRFRFR
ncbi:MAG: hypothetical protein Fur0032_11460 [Terrimicrobiaceae bacterium]